MRNSHLAAAACFKTYELWSCSLFKVLQYIELFTTHSTIMHRLITWGKWCTAGSFMQTFSGEMRSCQWVKLSTSVMSSVSTDWLCLPSGKTCQFHVIKFNHILTFKINNRAILKTWCYCVCGSFWFCLSQLLGLRRGVLITYSGHIVKMLQCTPQSRFLKLHLKQIISVSYNVKPQINLN